MRRLLVASEYGEPSHHEGIICHRLFNLDKEGQDLCLLLITKNLPGCTTIITTADNLQVPCQIHCTITGFGNTPLEPHIPFPDYILKQSIEVIKKYKIRPESVTIRIDPLIPEFLDRQMDTIPHTLETFANIGIKDCRISIVDYYPHVRLRFNKLGIKHPSTFQANKSTRDSIINKIAYLTIQLDMRLHLCAESLPLKPEINIDHEGCASKESWERLGITDLEPIRRRQRNTCTCNIQKHDLLQGLPKGCKDGCAYCYWRRKGE